MNPRYGDSRAGIRKLNIFGLAVLFTGFGAFAVWSTESQLSGAVIAPGNVVVSTNIKKVQHPTGGIVQNILVDDGSVVDAGQLLVRLDDTVTRATLGVIKAQLDELTARMTRLHAERDGADQLSVPNAVYGRGEQREKNGAFVVERHLFEAIRAAREGQRKQLHERIAQATEEIEGLSSQREAKDREISIIGSELAGVTELYRKGLTSLPRVNGLERDKARLQGERGQYIAEIARAKGKISETELQIIQLSQDFRTDVLKELRDTEAKIAELREKYTAADDQLKRVDIRAPQAGIVNGLSVHTPGGVIGPGETIMQIVPASDPLVVEAKVAPQDIDQISVGAPTAVRLMAGNQRTAPEISGTLTRVSADIARDSQSGQPGPGYYLVRVTLADEDVAKLGHMKLVPGMPAESFIRTYARTPLEYLLKPLSEQIARTFRER